MTEAESKQIIKEVKGIFDKIFEYSQSAQLDSFLICYDNSPTFLHISSDGKMRNYEEFKNISAEYYKSLQEQKISTTQETFQILNADFVILAWTGNIIAQFKNGNTMKMNNYSITSVFQKIDNKWKVIHSHESSLPPEIIKKR